MKHPALLTVVVATLSLSACGGGGGDSGAAVSDATVSTLTALSGTYVLPCKGDSYTASIGGPLTSESYQGTIVVSPSASTGQSEVSVSYQYYKGSATCEAAALDTDLAARGNVVAKNGSKTYTIAAGKTLTANIVTLTYTGMTLSKGNLTGSVPTFGTSTDLAYVIDNNRLYLSKGHRQADGLGDSLSDGAVKQ